LIRRHRRAACKPQRAPLVAKRLLHPQAIERGERRYGSNHDNAAADVVCIIVSRVCIELSFDPSHWNLSYRYGDNHGGGLLVPACPFLQKCSGTKRSHPGIEPIGLPDGPADKQNLPA